MKKYITKQSGIKGAGKGLFTNAFFKKGEVIGLAHVNDQPASEIGRNHNHNEKNPTAYSKKIDNKRYIYASKNLKPGEEITTNYRMQPELEQPEDFMREGGALLTKKVTCKKCGWKWDAEDGGKDITTCHKCGGQGLVHAQKGGESNVKFISSKDGVETPIYKKVDIRPSKIHGNGLFTKETIKKNEPIGICHVKNKDGQLIPSTILGMYNHNKKTPNVYEINKGDHVVMMPLRNISPGEELTADYDMVPIEGLQDSSSFRDGGNTNGMTGMMKARLAYANEFGNPAAERMINLPDNPYQFDNGDTGTHYMASMDNYAVPQIQDENGVLQLGDYGPESNEAIRFDSDEDANYFAENYKDVSPGFLNEKQYGGINKFVSGGKPCLKGEYWNGKKCVKFSKNAFVTSDHKKYIQRKAAFDDSLSLYNKSIELKEKLKPYFNTDARKSKDKVFDILDDSEVYRNYDKTKNKPTISPINVSRSTGKPLLVNASGNMINNSNVSMASYPIYKKPVQEVIFDEPQKKIIEKKIIKPTTRIVYVDCPSGSVPNGQTKDVTTSDPESPGNYLRTITASCELEKIKNLPILKPGLIQQQDYELQGADAYNEALENLEAPSYEPVESNNRRFGKTGSLKHKYDIFIPNNPFKMDVGPGGIRYGKHYPIPKFGMKESVIYDEGTNSWVNKQFRKDRKIQKETGLDRSYYEGSYDDEGNYIPGELENAEKENRRINFEGQYGRKDKKAQEQYNLEYDEYEFRKKFPTLLEDLNITYEDYINEYTSKKQYGGISNNYIEADLNEDEIEEYRRGGYIVEEIDNYQNGGAYTVKGSNGVYKKVNGKWHVDWNRSGKYQPLSKGDVKARTAVLDKMAKPLYDKDYDEMVAYKNLSTNDKIKKFEPKKEATKEELKKVSERLGRDYKPEDTKLQSVQMVYPEKYLIGPGGGAIGIARNAAGLGIKGLNKAMSYIPTPVLGGLNAYFAAEGIKEFSDPNSLTRKSMSRAYDDPTGSNIGDAAWDVGMNSLNFVGLPFGKAVKGTKNLGKFLNSHPAGWFQSAEQKLVNPKLWNSLKGNTSGDPLAKFYNWRDTQSLKQAVIREQKAIAKIPTKSIEEGRGIAVKEVREKLGDKSIKNVQKRISESLDERFLRRSGLPVQPIKTEWGDKIGGGQGQIFLNNLNPEEVIKLGSITGKEGTMQALVNAGNEAKTAGISGLENVALPTRAVSFGADPIKGTETGVQFMPWLGKPLSVKNPIAIPFEYGQGSSLAKNKLLKTVEELDKKNIGIDYYGKDNIMYDPISDSYKIVDLNYTQGPGMSQHWNKLDLPAQERLESKFGKIDIKKQGGESDDYIELDLNPEEIQRYKDGGYVVEELPEMQSGGSPSEVWYQYTGTPWSEARKKGLTDGSKEQNTELRKRLLAGEFGKPKFSNEKYQNVKSNYDKNVEKMVAQGKTLDQLVKQKVGTRAGLKSRFPELFKTKSKLDNFMPKNYNSSNSSSSKNKNTKSRWGNVTVKSNDGKPSYRKDDYIDMVQSKDSKIKAEGLAMQAEHKKQLETEKLLAKELKKLDPYAPDTYVIPGSFSNSYNPNNNTLISDNTNIYRQPMSVDWSFDPKYKKNTELFLEKKRIEDLKAKIKADIDSEIMSGLANNEGIKETVGQYNRRKKKYDNLDLLGKMIENDPADNYMPQPVGRSPFEDSPMTGIGGAPKMIIQAGKWLKPLWTGTKTVVKKTPQGIKYIKNATQPFRKATVSSFKTPLPLGKKITDATGGKLNLGNSIAAYFGADALYNQGDPNSDVVKSQSNFYNNPSWNTLGDASFETGVNALGFLGLGLGKQVIKPAYNASKNVIKRFKQVPKQLPGSPNSINQSVIPIKTLISKISDVDSFLHEVAGKTLKGKSNKKSIAEGNKWLTNWINNPITQKKIDLDWKPYTSRKNFLKDVYDLGYEQAKIFKPMSKEYPLSNQFKELFKRKNNIHTGNRGVSYIHDFDPFHRSNLNPYISVNTKKFPRTAGSWISRDPFISQAQRASTTVHEGVHDWKSNFLLKNSGQEDDILKILEPSIFKIHVKWKNKEKLSLDDKYMGYLANPTEVDARIMQLRKQFNLTPEESVKMTSEKAQKIINTVKSLPKRKQVVDPKFFDVIGNNPEKLAFLFRRLWGVVPVAGTVGLLNSKEKKQGGTVNNYVDAELTPKEIKNLIAQGYVIEQIN